MWHSYFHRIENKYQMRISLKRELVIRIDGRNITKSRNFSLLERKTNGFLDCFEKTIEIFTNKYKCLCFFGADEASFIFDEPEILLDELNIDKQKNARTNDIVALFSQEFFNSFNNLYNNEKIFWHGMCFSIEKEKVNSYIKFRSAIVKNVMTTYFLKRMMVNDAGSIKMEQRIAQNKKYSGYETVKELEKGILYLKGERIDKEEFLNNGNIKKIENKEQKNEEEYFDITKWDI